MKNLPKTFILQVVHIVHCTALPHLHFVVGKVRKGESRSVQICKLCCVVLCRAFPYLHFGKKGGGSICADLPARMVGERPNGAQRRLLGHADVPSCGTPMLSDRCSLNIRKKAISVHFCSLSLSRNIERYEFLVKHSILAPTTRSAAGFKYGFLFSTWLHCF